MSAPKLPPRIEAPQVPNSMLKGTPQQQPPKSNFFFILMMTFLVVWTIQVFKAKDAEPPVVPVEGATAKTDSMPTLSDAQRAELPKEFVQAAESAQAGVDPEFVTLGSLDPKSPYRMLVTLSNRGAALTRVELNESAYSDNSDHTGYLGQLIVDESYANDESRAGLPGVAAQVVGAGTPAEKAGLKVGDRIVAMTDARGNVTQINEMLDLREALLKTKQGDKIKLDYYDGAVLENNAAYKAARMTVAKYFAKRSSSPVDPFGVVEAPAAEDAVASSDFEVVEASENESAEAGDVAKEEASAAEKQIAELTDLGQVKTVEVELVRAPLSVLRPSGMVRDYDDYLDLVGLQGGYVDFGVNEENYLRNYDKNEPHVRKVNSEPASFLTTLSKIDNDKIVDWVPTEIKDRRALNLSVTRSPSLDEELAGVGMRNGYWEYVADESSESVAVFKKDLLERRLQVVKKYELVQVDESAKKSKKGEDAVLGAGRAYHLKLTFQVRNFDPSNERIVSSMMDGPTGLPLEGAWFSMGRKTGPKMGTYGLRDVVVSLNNRKSFNVVSCWNIAQGKYSQSDEIKLDFLGVDGQYFQCTTLPTAGTTEEKFAYSPIRVGTRVAEHINFTDVSYRMKSSEHRLAKHGQEGDSYSQEFVVFVGPKQRDVMADYGLSKSIVYGWFWFVSIPLLWILHFFHNYVVFNYGLAIMLLTILVRLCLYPLSRKQVLSSLRMQQLQPEIAKLKEKYKDNPQELMVAQQGLFKKYGVNPLSGCLPIFIQMPIFIGLYRALSIDVNLYGAPLFSKSVRWCSNLAAPDMAIDWSHFWNSIGWDSFNMSGKGFLSMFCLGPYFNVLPVITIALFLIQQKILMPPVVGDDEQARQQRSMRKMMNFMMIFMGFMFFKVPSGLCVYFIVSSLWGLLERKMLPKKQVELQPVADTAAPGGLTGASTRGVRNAQAARGKNGRPANQQEAPKGSFRAKWEELVKRAQEQQRLAKAEYEDRGKITKKYKKGR